MFFKNIIVTFRILHVSIFFAILATTLLSQLVSEFDSYKPLNHILILLSCLRSLLSSAYMIIFRGSKFHDL
jgi:hypothetical protein